MRTRGCKQWQKWKTENACFRRRNPRPIVCTDEGFRQLVIKRSKRFGTEAIQFIHCPLPIELQAQLEASLDASRKEQRNRND